MAKPGPDAAEIWQKEMVSFQTMTLGQKLKSSLSCFPTDTWLSQPFTAYHRSFLPYPTCPSVQNCPLTAKLIVSQENRAPAAISVLGPRQPAATMSHYCPCNLLTDSHLTSPKAGRAAGSTDCSGRWRHAERTTRLLLVLLSHATAFMLY